MSSISNTKSSCSNHMQNQSQINLHILIRCQYQGTFEKTFNGLSSAIPRVLKLNKYISYKYIGATADSEEIFSFQLSLSLFPLFLSRMRMWTRLSEAFSSLVDRSFTLRPITTPKHLLNREYAIF